MPKSVLVALHHQNFIKFQKPVMKLTKVPMVESEPNPFVHPPWNAVKLEGNIEKEYLFTTVISNDLVPFGCIKRRFLL